MNMTYDEAVEYIINVPRFNKYIDADNKANYTLLALMKELGNPHLKVKAIHVAGTNGKGSTVQFIKNILVECGYKVGCFVSPHLIKINERISITHSLKETPEDTYITDEEFLEAFIKVETAYKNIKSEELSPLTFFEYVFAIAAVYYATKDVDYCIYETGLGGRLDATNILKPEIAVITSIGLDHMKFLGDTIEQIANEKAGIIKSGIPVVYNTGDMAADKVIASRAAELSSPEINVAKGKYIINDFTPSAIDFSCSNSYYIYQHICISSVGIYQVNNAITAIEVCNNLPGVATPISEDIIRQACNSFFWQGRMEQLDNNVIIDGAHNLDAIIPFVKSVNRLCPHKEINILFAVADDKNYKDMIEYLCDNLKLKNVYVTSILSDRKVLSKEVADIFKEFLDAKLCKPTPCVDIANEEISNGPDMYNTVFYNNDLKKVFTIAYNKAREEDDILFCVGSLYLIGSIKDYYTNELRMEEL